ncbi:MAG TPA: FAD-dependent oxidoreductase, partial [Solirubrobacteraceae bacterium]|nr:FAD-dependent oxidoreductase [Solirubrobacteraceae bacterium]
MTADVLVAGGGLGGVAAALACARRGVPCVVCEPGPALGGQLTAQAVPPDEHPCVERRGVTAGYRALREAIRERYRRHEPLTAAARARAELNPGQGTVSRLCHEPRVSLAVLDELLAPHRAAGLVDVRLRHRALSAEVEGDRITAVTFADEEDGGELVVRPRIVLEATETGVLLELAGVEHRVGAESVAQTGEPHARPRPEPGNLQPVTWCFAVDHRPGEDHTIGRPPGYDEVAALRPAGLPAGHLTLTAPDPRTGAPVARTFRPDPPGDPAAVGPDFDDPSGDRDLWLFRRIAAAGNFAPGAYAGDITLACWPQLDFLGAPYLEGRADAPAAAEGARR